MLKIDIRLSRSKGTWVVLNFSLLNIQHTMNILNQSEHVVFTVKLTILLLRDPPFPDSLAFFHSVRLKDSSCKAFVMPPCTFCVLGSVLKLLINDNLNQWSEDIFLMWSMPVPAQYWLSRYDSQQNNFLMWSMPVPAQSWLSRYDSQQNKSRKTDRINDVAYSSLRLLRSLASST